MIKGIGIDLVENKRIELLYEKYKHTFAEKILSEDELVEYHQSDSKVSYLSKHFASKEAFSKAIGTGLFRKGLYPAFDITPPHLVNAIITDRGVFKANQIHTYQDTSSFIDHSLI